MYLQYIIIFMIGLPEASSSYYKPRSVPWEELERNTKLPKKSGSVFDILDYASINPSNDTIVFSDDCDYGEFIGRVQSVSLVEVPDYEL